MKLTIVEKNLLSLLRNVQKLEMSITEHDLEALDVIPAPRNKTGASAAAAGGVDFVPGW